MVHPSVPELCPAQTKRSILSQDKSSNKAPLSRIRLTQVAVTLGCLLAASGLIASISPADEPLPIQEQITRDLPVPVADLIIDPHPFIHEEQIQANDTLRSLFLRLGVRDSSALNFLNTPSRAKRIAKLLHPGATVIANLQADGGLISLTFPQMEAQNSIFITRTDAHLAPSIESTTAPSALFVFTEGNLEIEKRIEMRSAQIDASLFAATDEIGLPDSIAKQLSEIFGNEIDFHHQLQKGDRFSVTYEAFYHRGKFMHTGRIVAAEFYNQGEWHTALWYARDPARPNQGSYYSADGKSLQQGFLRSPLEYSRITSGFAVRFHPILGKWVAHNGIDYSAPTGTKVRATADGIVEFAGWQNGYGNVIIVQHEKGYSTAYAHLSKIAANLKEGGTIQQGQTLGAVGQTGWATGPHLHYELRIDGVYKDPQTVKFPTIPPLTAHELNLFRTHTAEHLATLQKAERVALIAKD